MLGQLLIVRLKAAERALKDGRLDEAYRLATAPDLRDHRRAIAVLTALTGRLIERARAHFRADRFSEALVDLDRAEAGGVMKEEIAELRGHVRTVQAEQHRSEQSRRERLGAAKRRIEGGSLAAGRRVLERASEGDHAARDLRRQAEDRAEEVATILEQADKLMGQGQWASAADRVRRAKSIDAHHEAVTLAETALCGKVLDKARASIVDGRIARARSELACLGMLGEALPVKREITDLLKLAREAARCVGAHAYGDARRHVMSLDRLLPKARWIGQAIEQLRQVDDISTELCAGPLGEAADAVAADAVAITDEPAGKPTSLDDTVALPGRAATQGTLPDRLLLLVDGGGSFLILRGDQVSLGRAAASDPADVAIFSDLAERHANVSRMEDDYFLLSAKDVEVSGQKTKHQLLRDGDRIVLGRKAKLTYRLPSLKSPSAALDLSDTTKMPNDVRRVVLFAQHATIGQGPTAHIPCRHAAASLILFERRGLLWVRLKSDGHVDVEARPLGLGEPIEVAGVSLVLEPWTIRTPGATM